MRLSVVLLACVVCGCASYQRNWSKPDLVVQDKLLEGEILESDFASIAERKGDQATLEKDTLRNIHVAGRVDTVYILSFNDSVLRYFKGESNEFLLSANIGDEEVKLRNGIHVGMKRDALVEQIPALNNYTSRRGIIRIEDAEQLQHVDIQLRRDRIRKIIYEGHAD